MSRINISKNIDYDEEKKLYYVTFYFGKDSNKKNIRQRKTFTKKRDAVEALKKFESDKVKGNIVNPQNIILKDYLSYWIDDIKKIKCEETTLCGYRNIINNHINPYMGDVKLQLVTPATINKYFSMLSVDKKLSNNSIKKHFHLLKDVFKIAVTEEKVLKNPLDKVDQIKVIRKEQKSYTAKQLQILLDVVKDTRMEIVIMLAALLGLRREEIAGLKWKYVDLENNILKVVEVRVQAGKVIVEKQTKTISSHRTLSIPHNVVDVFNRIKIIQDDFKNKFGDSYCNEGYVVAWEDGSPYRPNYISDLFKKVIGDNNLPPLRLHDLRHTFASIANDLGVSIYDISKALGHGEIGTTGKIYTHMFDNTHKKAIDIVSNSVNKS